MIVAFSTSSPLASVALIDESGIVVASGETDAPMRASGACIELLQRLLKDTGLSLEDATLFAADLGPGSFTGVKVAVTMAKSFAFAKGVPAAGANSFDLIDPRGPVVLPSKRGEWFIRRPGEEPIRTDSLPTGTFTGYGPSIESQVFPHAKRFAAMVNDLRRVEPVALLPEYLIEPSISLPKKPLSPIGDQHG